MNASLLLVRSEAARRTLCAERVDAALRLRLHKGAASFLDFVFVFVLASGLACALPAAAEALPADGIAFIPATALSRAAPHYPARPLHAGQEGWVVVSYCIDPAGHIGVPEIESSTGVKEFEDAALETARTWTFSPAIAEHGPIEQCEQYQLTFRLEHSNPFARDEFVQQVVDIGKRLHTGKVDEAEVMLNRVTASNRYETAHLFAARARLAAARHDDLVQLRLLEVALRNSTDLDPHFALHLQKQVVDLALRCSQWGDYVAQVQQLQREHPKSTTKAMLEHAAEIDAELQTQRVITTPVRLTKVPHDARKADYTVPMRRRKFQFGKLSGQFDYFEVSCSGHHLRGPVIAGKTWDVPQAWGSCDTTIRGAENAHFDFDELPSGEQAVIDSTAVQPAS